MAAKVKAKILPFVESVFPSITSAYVQIANPTDDILLVHCINTLDKEVVITFDGAVDHFKLPAYAGFTFDFRSNDIQYGRLDLQIKHSGTAPTTGKIVFTLVQQKVLVI